MGSTGYLSDPDTFGRNKKFSKILSEYLVLAVYVLISILIELKDCCELTKVKTVMILEG